MKKRFARRIGEGGFDERTAPQPEERGPGFLRHPDFAELQITVEKDDEGRAFRYCVHHEQGAWDGLYTLDFRAGTQRYINDRGEVHVEPIAPFFRELIAGAVPLVEQW